MTAVQWLKHGEKLKHKKGMIIKVLYFPIFFDGVNPMVVCTAFRDIISMSTTIQKRNFLYFLAINYVFVIGKYEQDKGYIYRYV